MASFVPYDYEGEFPEDFFDRIVSEGTFTGVYGSQEGWFTNYQDTEPEPNGYADFYDQYISGEPGIITKPSQGHAGT